MLKNREVRLYSVFSVVLIGAVCVLSALSGISAPAAVLLCGGLLLLAWWFATARRYGHMRNMIGEIDEILHGCEDISLSDYNEGELSLLKNEISKMTVMLRSQAEQLKRDKIGLADSLADISHQIRTPLTALNLLLAALKKEELEPEKKRETLFEMSRQLDRIDRLVVGLLKLARIDAGTIVLKKERVELEKLVANALQPLEIMLELKGIRVKRDISGCYSGDISWSEEAFGNILKNCMEHTREGGVITVTGRENAMYTELVIEDNGKGIAKEDLPHLFERFYKGVDSGAGSYGIGLALAKMIIAGQNGTILAENREAEEGTGSGGARFIVRFYKGAV